MFNRKMYIALKRARENGYAHGWKDREKVAGNRERQLLQEMSDAGKKHGEEKTAMQKTHAENLRSEKSHYDLEIARERARIAAKLKEMRSKEQETNREMTRVRELLDDVKSLAYFIRTILANQKTSLHEAVHVLSRLSDCKIDVDEVIVREREFRKRLNAVEIHGKRIEQ